MDHFAQIHSVLSKIRAIVITPESFGGKAGGHACNDVSYGSVISGAFIIPWARALHSRDQDSSGPARVVFVLGRGSDFAINASLPFFVIAICRDL